MSLVVWYLALGLGQGNNGLEYKNLVKVWGLDWFIWGQGRLCTRARKYERRFFSEDCKEFSIIITKH